MVKRRAENEKYDTVGADNFIKKLSFSIREIGYSRGSAQDGRYCALFNSTLRKERLEYV